MLNIPSKLYLPFAILLAFVFNTENSEAQRRYDISYQEVGGWIGAANYYGDLNQNFSIKGARPAFGGYFRHTFTPYIAVRVGAAFGYVGFKDSYTNSPWQNVRNLSFRTHIAEVGGSVEFNFLRYIPMDKRHYATPYLTLGLSVFHFSPQAKFDGKWHSLSDIGTEGQQQTDLTGVKPYKKLQPALPIGIGFKYWIKGKWTLSAEMSYRFTFTDYIDDTHGTYINPALVSDPTAAYLSDPSIAVLPNDPLGDQIGTQRGDHVTKDSYMFFQISLSYAIFKVKCPAQ